eukprot:TRINITY_DN7321_c0_g1_i15.p1 TRINITY_DN7321_c0_g1~~TRINITY_DN7321_c0_g1_i15.p1  ORF type:complete len:919 (-),score=189.68 TRINITY_DN7321_c0_g1_i15:314-3070(-)
MAAETMSSSDAHALGLTDDLKIDSSKEQPSDEQEDAAVPAIGACSARTWQFPQKGSGATLDGRYRQHGRGFRRWRQSGPFGTGLSACSARPSTVVDGVLAVTLELSDQGGDHKTERAQSAPAMLSAEDKAAPNWQQGWASGSCTLPAPPPPPVEEDRHKLRSPLSTSSTCPPLSAATHAAMTTSGFSFVPSEMREDCTSDCREAETQAAPAHAPAPEATAADAAAADAVDAAEAAQLQEEGEPRSPGHSEVEAASRTPTRHVTNSAALYARCKRLCGRCAPVAAQGEIIGRLPNITIRRALQQSYQNMCCRHTAELQAKLAGPPKEVAPKPAAKKVQKKKKERFRRLSREEARWQNVAPEFPKEADVLGPADEQQQLRSGEDLLPEACSDKRSSELAAGLVSIASAQTETEDTEETEATVATEAEDVEAENPNEKLAALLQKKVPWHDRINEVTLPGCQELFSPSAFSQRPHSKFKAVSICDMNRLQLSLQQSKVRDEVIRNHLEQTMDKKQAAREVELRSSIEALEVATLRIIVKESTSRRTRMDDELLLAYLMNRQHFEDTPRPVLEVLKQNLTIERYRPDQVLSKPQDELRGVFIVLSGCVRRDKLGEEHEELDYTNRHRVIVRGGVINFKEVQRSTGKPLPGQDPEDFEAAALKLNQRDRSILRAAFETETIFIPADKFRIAFEVEEIRERLAALTKLFPATQNWTEEQLNRPARTQPTPVLFGTNKVVLHELFEVCTVPRYHYFYNQGERKPLELAPLILILKGDVQLRGRGHVEQLSRGDFIGEEVLRGLPYEKTAVAVGAYTRVLWISAADYIQEFLNGVSPELKKPMPAQQISAGDDATSPTAAVAKKKKRAKKVVIAKVRRNSHKDAIVHDLNVDGCETDEASERDSESSDDDEPVDYLERQAQVVRTA